MNDISTLVGIPYVKDGDSLEGFNCWGLLRYIQRHYFGKELPPVPLGDAEACKQAHAAALRDHLYLPVPVPVHGDAVLLRGGNDPHVGVYLSTDGGGIIHACNPHGVIWTKLRDLRMQGYPRVQYYRVNP